MITKEELKEIAIGGLEKVMGLKEIKEAEVFVSYNGIDYTKINFTSHIPCNGVEQPLYFEMKGCSVRVILKDGKFGFGLESSLSKDAVLSAGKKATAIAYKDPFMYSLPKPLKEMPAISDYHDKRILESGGEVAVECGWKALDGLIETYKQGGFCAKDRIILNGDLKIIRELMAVASNTGIQASDVSTIMMAYLTTMLEKHNAKGTGWATGSRIDAFRPEDAGRMAALSAIKTINGKRIKSGVYEVILGPQAVTDLVDNFLSAGVDAEAMAAGQSPFTGKYKKQVVSPLLNVYDDGSIEGLASSKAYTCEGIPTKRISLIKEGKLIDFLSDYSTERIWNEKAKNEKVSDYREKLRELLGTSEIPKIEGRNGFRFSRDGRSYMAEPSAHFTNLFIEGAQKTPEEKFISGKILGNGVYIGRLWYTYPINGLAKADVTSTIIGDSYIVKDGKIIYPLKPNTVRVNDNFNRMFNNIKAVGDKQHGTIIWDSEGVVYTPYLLIKDVHLDNIAEFMG